MTKLLFKSGWDLTHFTSNLLPLWDARITLHLEEDKVITHLYDFYLNLMNDNDEDSFNKLTVKIILSNFQDISIQMDERNLFISNDNRLL